MKKIFALMIALSLFLGGAALRAEEKAADGNNTAAAGEMKADEAKPAKKAVKKHKRTTKKVRKARKMKKADGAATEEKKSETTEKSETK